MPQSYRVRRGTAAAWTAANPVLAQGEPAYVTDTGDFKIGDGTTAWSSLPAITASGAAQLSAAKNVFTGKIELNGGFTNAYDTALWIAPANRANPTNNSQGMYIQHRLSGDLGGLVHDAGASELRVSGGSNGGGGQNAWEASLVITGGANTLGSMNGITSNFHAENSPTGTVTNLALYRSQTVPTLVGGITVGTIYGMYVEPQTVGTTENWSVYAPGGTSLFGTLMVDGAAGTSTRSLQFTTNKSLRWLVRANSTAESGSNVGTDFEILARTDAGAVNFTPFAITRSSGQVQINNGLKVTGNVGFYGTTPVAKPTVTGSKGANAALTSLLTALASQGILTDSST